MSPKASNRALRDTSQSMPALLLTEKEVEGLLQMDDALVAVEEGLRAMGRGEATNRPRQRVGTRETAVNVMLASWPARGYAGFKYYTASHAGIRFWVHLFDMATGELLAVIQSRGPERPRASRRNISRAPMHRRSASSARDGRQRASWRQSARSAPFGDSDASVETRRIAKRSRRKCPPSSG